MDKKIKNKNKGFTLMEMLIAISIFVIFVVASLSIYSATLRASQETRALTSVQKEAQFMMQVMAKRIRTSHIMYDYSGYSPSISNPTTILALEDFNGDEYYFKQVNSSIAVAINPTNPLEDGEYNLIPAENVSVESLEFFINPTTNPFVSLDVPPVSQPYVTIVMNITSSKAGQDAQLRVQQTVPQRSGVPIE